MNLIRQARHLLGVTQKQLASEWGVSTRSIERWEALPEVEQIYRDAVIGLVWRTLVAHGEISTAETLAAEIRNSHRSANGR